MIKKLYIDLETTGVNPKENGILEIGCIFEVGDFAEEFSIQCSPFESDIVEAAALKVNGVAPEDVFNRMPPEDAYTKLTKKLSRYVNKYEKKDKMFFIGYNVDFDSNFLREFFLKNGDKYFGSFFFYPAIDVMGIAALACIHKRHTLKNFKLITVAREFGIEVSEEKSHGALYDIQITRKLLKAATDSLNEYKIQI